MSVQPALAEAMALTEMQMAAFEGAHWERQLIQAFTRRKKKKGSATIVRRLFHLYCATGTCFYPLSSCLWIPWTLQRFRIHQDRYKGKEMT